MTPEDQQAFQSACKDWAVKAAGQDLGEYFFKAGCAHRDAQASAAHDCTRSHPHENMSLVCQLKTDIARLNAQAAQNNYSFEKLKCELELENADLSYRDEQAAQVNEQDELQPAANWIFNRIHFCGIKDLQENLMVDYKRAKSLYINAIAAAEAKGK